MKIACQSCQAKYTIADEKVVGKVVKIRCKKCGSTIVVNGQNDGSDERTEIRSTGSGPGEPVGGDEWIINVADNDQRTLSTAQVAAEFAAGAFPDDVFCWRDGMGDWLPLRDIEALCSACGLNGAAQPAQSVPPEPAAPVQDDFAPPLRASAPGASPLAGIFGGSGLAAQPASAQPEPAAARRAGGRSAGADLFGRAETAGSESDVMTSAPQNPANMAASEAAETKLTGQRNENSVLFSLSTLTANAPKKGADSSPAVNDDGSGLIDIRALSASMNNSTGNQKKTNHADDIMNLGGGGAFSAPLAAPVLTAPLMESPEAGAAAGASSSTKFFMMFGVLALMLVGGMVGLYFVLKPGGSPPPVASASPDTSAAPAPKPSATAPADSAAAAAPAPSASAVAMNDTTKAAPPNVGGHAPRPTGAGAGAGASPAPAAPPPTPAPAPAPPAGGGGLDQLIAGSVKNPSAIPAPPPAAGGSSPYDRGAAAAALGQIADGVGGCKKAGGPTGDGHVSITFAPNGSVASAIVDQPPYAGTAVGGCVAGKFRGAHVPAFSGSNITVGKRFSIN
jgi:predicted Zn finger-like uncharacterized protein